MNLESIVEALECSYQGNPDQITQAQEFLLEMASQPAEYSTILVNIMTNDNIQSMIRVAAAIQFKYLLRFLICFKIIPQIINSLLFRF